MYLGKILILILIMNIIGLFVYVRLGLSVFYLFIYFIYLFSSSFCLNCDGIRVLQSLLVIHIQRATQSVPRTTCNLSTTDSDSFAKLP